MIKSNNKNFEPSFIWEELQQGIAFKSGLPGGSLFETVRENELFALGRQWETVNAPDLDKPVFNILKRVISYFVAMIASDKVSVSCQPFNCPENEETKRIMQIIGSQITEVFEDNSFSSLGKKFLRWTCIRGDCGLHIYFDHAKETGQEAMGAVCFEIVKNTEEFFGNPKTCDIDSQPYIILSSRKPLEEVRKETEERGLNSETIEADSDETSGNAQSDGPTALCTVLTKYMRGENKNIWVTKTTKTAVIMPATDTGYKYYPYARMSWEEMSDCCHGQAAVTGLIPNQIATNKLHAMIIKFFKDLAFRKVIYDKSKIEKWDNRVGAIAVAGDVNNAVTSLTDAPSLPPSIVPYLGEIVDRTRDLMGASDAALGNVRPDNTSAIIALQQTTAMPLDLQRLDYYEFCERVARVTLDVIKTDYGIRDVLVTDEMGTQELVKFDFETLRNTLLKLKVDVGASSYWSEVRQVQTLDSLREKQIIDDETYLELMPEGYIPGKNKILAKLKAKRAIVPSMGEGMTEMENTVPIEMTEGEEVAESETLPQVQY